MRYHNITKDDMNNGDGLRVVLWVSGCSHRCKGCQNPITWNPEDGLVLTSSEVSEIYAELDKDYISGITFSGGDPLYESNRKCVQELIANIKSLYPGKTIWLYTGYTWEEISRSQEMTDVVSQVDVLVDGEYIEELRDVNYHWAGSTNQRVINVPQTLKEGRMVLYESGQEGWNYGNVQRPENCKCCE